MADHHSIIPANSKTEKCKLTDRFLLSLKWEDGRRVDEHGIEHPLKPGQRRKSKIAKLLSAMQEETKPVQPKQLGVIGAPSLAWRFFEGGAEVGGHSFQYKAIPAENDGRPCLVETAFAPSRSIMRRHLVVGVNWSPAISGNPFKAIGKGGDSLDSLLASLRVQHHDKAILFVHVACPTVQYIDRGKAAMVVGGGAQFADEEDTFDDRVAP